MNISHARFILSLAACLMAAPLSAQTTPPPANGSGSAASGGSATTVGGAGAAKPAPDTKAAQKEVQETLNKMDAAIKRKDLRGVMKYFAPDYKLKDLKGKTVTLSQIRDGYQSYFNQAQSVTTASSTVEKVEAKKDAYAVTGQSTLKATTRDAQNKSHEMAQTSAGLLTWKKTKDGWQITGGKLIAQENTYDGKPYSSAAPKQTAANNNRTNRSNSNRNFGYPSGWGAYHAPKIHKVKRIVRIG